MGVVQTSQSTASDALARCAAASPAVGSALVVGIAGKVAARLARHSACLANTSAGTAALAIVDGDFRSADCSCFGRGRGEKVVGF